MRRNTPLGVVAAALLAAAAAAAAAAGTVSQAPVATAAAMEITDLRDGPGRDLTVGRCIICHSVEYIPSNAPAMNRAAWQKTIQKMKDKFGAPITDEEAKQILDYLAANYSGKQ
jgi:sulfite dehydrogenase (cytochrome) subunit B